MVHRRAAGCQVCQSECYTHGCAAQAAMGDKRTPAMFSESTGKHPGSLALPRFCLTSSCAVQHAQADQPQPMGLQCLCQGRELDGCSPQA